MEARMEAQSPENASGEHARDLIARAREIGRPLRADKSDRIRLAGWLLTELADLAERLDAAKAVAAERERLFTAIRHALPLDAPWRGEALDLIYKVWQPEARIAPAVGTPR